MIFLRWGLCSICFTFWKLNKIIHFGQILKFYLKNVFCSSGMHSVLQRCDLRVLINVHISLLELDNAVFEQNFENHGFLYRICRISADSAVSIITSCCKQRFWRLYLGWIPGISLKCWWLNKISFENYLKWYWYRLRTLEFSNPKSTFQLLRGQNRRWEVYESF